MVIRDFRQDLPAEGNPNFSGKSFSYMVIRDFSGKIFSYMVIRDFSDKSFSYMVNRDFSRNML